jgi:hypothetical protein
MVVGDCAIVSGALPMFSTPTHWGLSELMLLTTVDAYVRLGGV